MERFRSQIIDWANEHDDIRAVLVVGSRAQRARPADDYADYDVVAYATNPRTYAGDQAWLARFGTLWVALLDWLGEDEPEWLALYDGGDKLDIAFFALDRLKRHLESGDPGDVLGRGYDILVDKDGLAARLPAPPDAMPPVDPPTSERFAAAINTFWHGAVYVAKQIKRDNLWTVKYRDWTMKQQLLAMVEWHARAVSGWGYDTWYEGKRITEWADAETLAALTRCFGHFDAADSWRALLATMDLFRRLATETAARLGYAYPAALDAHATGYVFALGVGKQ
jgi:aminoglycoside 6-adenylyltransferase